MEKNSKKITIHLWARDSYIFEFPSFIANAVDQAHKHDQVILDAHGEGISLERLVDKDKKLIDILTEICQSNNWPKNKFIFKTGNLIQDPAVWPEIRYNGNLRSAGDGNTFFYGRDIGYQPKEKSFTHYFGCLVNGSTWPRLWISAFLDKNFFDKTFQTFRRSLTNPAHMINLDLDRLFFYFSNHKKLNDKTIGILENFLKKLPIEKHKDTNMHKVEHFNWATGAYDAECLGWYDNFLIDVVCESSFSGQTFFLTEKTARPLITRNPFLIFGPASFLKNLREIGFKTFQNCWDESYDDFEGVMRINAIEKILESISRYTLQDLKLLYEKMKPTLDHNYSLYHSLRGDDIIKIFVKKSNND